MRTYKEYKVTGFSLLQEIPISWNLQKIKYFAKIYNGDSLNDDYKSQFESDNSDDLAYISSKDINVDTSVIQYENGLRIPKDYGKFKIAPKNSTLLCIEGGSAGRKIAFTNQEVYFVNKLACFKTENAYTSKFLYYSFKSNLFQTQFKNSITGMIGGVSIANLKNFYLSLPSPNEQKQITNYLDYKIGVIEKIIQQKEKLIALLKEKRQAIINQAVTKGIKANVKMKNSGIDCFGEVPNHWDVLTIKRITKEHRQGYYSSGDYDEKGCRVVRITDLKDNNEIDTSDSPFYDLDEENLNRYKLEKGDFLFQRTGSHKKIGVFNSDELAVYGSFLIRFRFKHDTNHSYLLYFFNSLAYQNQLNSFIHGGVNPNIHVENIKDCFITLPPLSEQEHIVKYLNISTNKLNVIISKSQDIVEKLKEYRLSIITEAVTGRIDVKDWQIKKRELA